MCAAIIDPPESIGKYRIECILGRGSMGVVYKAYDPFIDRPVAMKVLQGHLIDSDKGQDFIQRFHQEAKAAARCLHPNIVTVFDFGTANGVPFIIMEYVEGIDLRSKIVRDAPFSINVTVHICRQILEALAYAHSKGVIHRDIKPSNILLREDGSLKVSDFGVARLDTSSLTHTGYMMGTPNYMAPEALMGMPTDKRWDLYSVGVLMYELLTKHIPSKGMSVTEALQVLEKSYTLSPKQLRATQSVLQHALCPDPTVRFSSAESFLRELKQIPMDNTGPEEFSSLVTKDDITLAVQQQQALASQGRPISSSGRWSTDVLRTLEMALTRHIGPMARFLVEKCSRDTNRLDELCSKLSQHIPSERERREFLKTLDNSGIFSLWLARMPSNSYSSQSVPAGSHISAKSTNVSALSPEMQRALSQLLAFYVGPLATRLVDKAARQYRTLNEIQNQLALHIPNARERDEFFRKLAKLPK